nr:hypothetical protein [Tanacetum cinerariifolium]
MMRADELYKFLDGTLKTIHDELHHKILDFRLGLEMEQLVGAQELEMDYKLMTRTRDLPRDIPLDRIEVLRYDTKGVKVRKRKLETKTDLTLKQTQRGVSDEVLREKENYLLILSRILCVHSLKPPPPPLCIADNHHHLRRCLPLSAAAVAVPSPTAATVFFLCSWFS